MAAPAIAIPAAYAPAPGLVLDDETHTYRWEGREVPGVTRVLGDAKILDYSGIPQHILDRAAERGKAAHLALEYLDAGTLDRATLDSELEPYVHAYEAFCIDSGFMCWSAEKCRYNKQRGYAGRFDRTGTFGRDAAIVDFKTGVFQEGHLVQIAGGYGNMFPQPRRFRHIALQLFPTGKYRVHEASPAKFEYYSSIFFCALACVQFRGRKGR
jgi:hypothetical protein